jgi:hypothetical protein
LILGVSGESIPYGQTRSLVFSGVVTWIISPSDTLMTVPVTVRIGWRANERAVREKVVNAASRQMRRRPLVENAFEIRFLIFNRKTVGNADYTYKQMILDTWIR